MTTAEESSESSAPEESGARPDPDDTVGTGSFFALGCTLFTLVIIFVGVAIFIFRQVG